jgi:hypothetical protein
MRRPNPAGVRAIWGAILRAPDATPAQLAEATGYNAGNIAYVAEQMRAQGWSWRPKKPQAAGRGRTVPEARPTPPASPTHDAKAITKRRGDEKKTSPRRSVIDPMHVNSIETVARKLGLEGVTTLEQLAPHLVDHGNKQGGGSARRSARSG